MTCILDTTLLAKLIAADARMQRATRAYKARLNRDDTTSENEWPESAECDAACDDRLDIEAEALASGDPVLVDFVRRRRHRDGEFFPLTLIVARVATSLYTSHESR